MQNVSFKKSSVPCWSASLAALKNALSKNAFTFVVLLASLAQSGCSVFMAAEQPDKKDLGILTVGTSRNRLLREFGQPLTSRLVGMNRVDLFTFTQGYSKEAKVGRAVAHGTLDIATSGVWEIAGTPTEAVFSGEKLSYEVTYDRYDRVLRVVRLGE
jgi:hypothetical protein